MTEASKRIVHLPKFKAKVGLDVMTPRVRHQMTQVVDSYRPPYSVDQAQEAADDWVQDYNEFRPHESLGDVAPMEFMPRKFVKEISSFKLAT